jgi:hypothetical protein
MKKLTAALLVASALTTVALVASAGAATVSPVTSGLDSPRGLAFLPNGTLAVAEAGHGGDVCIPDGPCFGVSGQISTIDLATGWHSPFVSGLFSLMDPEGGAIGIDGLSAQGGRLLGIMGIFPQAFAGDCSQIPGAPSDCPQVLAAAQSQAGALLKFTPSGNWNKLADVGGFDYQFTIDHPGGSVYGTEIDANPYGLLAQPRGTYVADAGSNTLDWVSNDGTVSVVHRFPVPNPEEPFPTDAVPTCVAAAGGHLTVADLAGRIWRVNPGFVTLISGQNGNHYTGCASDAAGNVYVVSMFHGLFPNPGTGSIVRVSPTQSVSTVSGTEGLVFPNMIATSPDGALYVSVNSVCTTAPPNPCGEETGGVVKVTP